jgi:hypothetical protein
MEKKNNQCWLRFGVEKYYVKLKVNKNYSKLRLCMLKKKDY